MKFKWVIIFLYSLLLLLGGLIGYFTANSVPSLVAGAGSSFIMLVCGFAMYYNFTQARFVALTIAILLLAFFSYRWASSQNFFPGGLMTFASLLTAIILGYCRPKEES